MVSVPKQGNNPGMPEGKKNIVIIFFIPCAIRGNLSSAIPHPITMSSPYPASESIIPKKNM